MGNCIDNCMEWLTGQRIGAVTFSQKRWINKIKSYAKDYPDEIKIIAEDPNGTIYAHVPISWFKFSPPRKGREFSEEEKSAAAERLKNARNKKREVST